MSVMITSSNDTPDELKACLVASAILTTALHHRQGGMNVGRRLLKFWREFIQFFSSPHLPRESSSDPPQDGVAKGATDT